MAWEFFIRFRVRFIWIQREKLYCTYQKENLRLILKNIQAKEYSSLPECLIVFVFCLITYFSYFMAEIGCSQMSICKKCVRELTLKWKYHFLLKGPRNKFLMNMR